MKDYELTLTVKNAPLLNLMRSKGINTAAELYRATGVNQATIGSFLNLSRAPYDNKGQVLKSANTLALFFDLPVEFLFPEDQLYLALDKNKFTVQTSKDDMTALSNSCPSLLIQAEESENHNDKPFNGMLEGINLTERMELALKLRYQEDMNFADMGKLLGGVRAQRAREILMSAERRVRESCSIKGHDLAGLAGDYNNTHKHLIK